MFKSVKDCGASLILRLLLHRSDGVMDIRTILAPISMRSKPEIRCLTGRVICEYLAHLYLYLARLGAICSSFWVEDI